MIAKWATVIAAAIAITLTTGCQPDQPASGGINGHSHPSAGDHQSGGTLWAIALLAAGTAIVITTTRRQATS